MAENRSDLESKNSGAKSQQNQDLAKEREIERHLDNLMKAYSSGDPQLIDQALEEMPGIKKLREQEAAEAARNSRGEEEQPDTLT